MKNLQTSIVTSLLIFLMISVSHAQTPIARVSMLKGNVFSVHNGNTSTLKEGDYLYRGTQVISEEGTSTVISDFFNHKITLSGATDIEIFNNEYKLNRGYVLIQSSHLENSTFRTANSIVTFSSGDAILSFDSANDRTQLMSINGTFQLANPLEPNVYADVRDGNFSFIDNQYENGIPRNPTNIGESSYVKLISLFKDVTTPTKRQIATQTNAKRAIASIETPEKKGKIIIRRSSVGRTPSSVTEKKVSKRPTIPITVYRLPELASQVNKKESTRAPASIKEVKPPVTKSITINKDFESSLMDAYKKQRRHDGEVLRLIDELETYDQDFKKEY